MLKQASKLSERKKKTSAAKQHIIIQPYNTVHSKAPAADRIPKQWQPTEIPQKVRTLQNPLLNQLLSSEHS